MLCSGKAAERAGEEFLFRWAWCFRWISSTFDALADQPEASISVCGPPPKLPDGCSGQIALGLAHSYMIASKIHSCAAHGAETHGPVSSSPPVFAVASADYDGTHPTMTANGALSEGQPPAPPCSSSRVPPTEPTSTFEMPLTAGCRARVQGGYRATIASLALSEPAPGVLGGCFVGLRPVGSCLLVVGSSTNARLLLTR